MLEPIPSAASLRQFVIPRHGQSVSFRPGEQFSAVVRAANAAGQVRLDLKGVTMAARTRVEFQAGQQVRVEVAQVQPNVVLRLVATTVPPEFVLQSLRTNLPAWRPFGEMLQKFIDQFATVQVAKLPSQLAGSLQKLSPLMMSLIVAGSTDTSPHFLRQLLDRSGLRYEQRLAAMLQSGADAVALRQLLEDDLKGLLLLMRTYLDGQNPLQQLALRRHLIQLDGFLQSLLAQQLLDRLATGGKRRRFHVPLGAPGQLYTATVEVEEQERGEDEPHAQQGNDYRLVFTVDFGIFGRVMVELRLSRQQVSGRLHTDDQRVLVALQRLVPHLRRRLEQAGFQLGELAVALVNLEGVRRFGMPQPVAEAGINMLSVEA